MNSDALAAQPFDSPAFDSMVFYGALIALIAVERLMELVISRRHEQHLRERGAVEVGAGHFPVMVALHSAFLVACVAEVWWLDRPFVAPLAAAMTVLIIATMSLRFWVIATLGQRWTARVLVLPKSPPVTDGPYRFLRHPNYLGVVVEILAIPLVHCAWLTALLFSVANAALLAVRIRSEESALTAAGGYEQFAAYPRLLPVAGKRRKGPR